VNTQSRSHVAGDACYLAGGAALVTSAYVHWVARGAGSGLRGHRLIDTIVALGRHVPAFSAGRLTVIWYLIPVLGAASWIAFGLQHERSRSLAARVIAVAALGATVLAYLGFRAFVGPARLGWGPKLAVIGALALCVASWVPLIVGRSRLSQSAGL
jgi:hypothetical protein